METITPQKQTTWFHVYCIECNFAEYASTLAEAGRIADSHSEGPHEVECYDEANDRMVRGGEMAVAFEESEAN